MATIEKHISDLLHLHDCVIVPGLGGLVANHSTATVVEERHLFVPPSKKIGFNRSLSHNDGLLVNHLCRRESIDYGEAMDRIHVFVSETLKTIDRNEVIVFEGIGDLRKDALGNVLFTPQQGDNSFLPTSFGLGQFHFEPLQSESPAGKSEEPVRRLLRSRSPRYWASVAAMLAGLFLFTSELKMPEQTRVNESNLFYMSRSTGQSLQPRADQLSYPEEVTLQEAIDPGELTLNEKSIETLSNDVVPPPKTGYHLIAASFKHVEPAQHSLSGLRDNGFPEAAIIEADNGRFRISLCVLPNKSEALKRLYEVREMPRLGDAWLLRN